MHCTQRRFVQHVEPILRETLLHDLEEQLTLPKKRVLLDAKTLCVSLAVFNVFQILAVRKAQYPEEITLLPTSQHQVPDS